MLFVGKKASEPLSLTELIWLILAIPAVIAIIYMFGCAKNINPADQQREESIHRLVQQLDNIDYSQNYQPSRLYFNAEQGFMMVAFPENTELIKKSVTLFCDTTYYSGHETGGSVTDCFITELQFKRPATCEKEKACLCTYDKYAGKEYRVITADANFVRSESIGTPNVRKTNYYTNEITDLTCIKTFEENLITFTDVNTNQLYHYTFFRSQQQNSDSSYIDVIKSKDEDDKDVIFLCHDYEYCTSAFAPEQVEPKIYKGENGIDKIVIYSTINGRAFDSQGRPEIGEREIWEITPIGFTDMFGNVERTYRVITEKYVGDGNWASSSNSATNVRSLPENQLLNEITIVASHPNKFVCRTQNQDFCTQEDLPVIDTNE